MDVGNVRSVVGVVRAVPFAFRGRIEKRGEGSFAGVPPLDELAVVRVSHGYKVPLPLGKLAGRLVTVLLDPRSELDVGYDGIFFAESWVYGEGLAVREVEHLDGNDKTNELVNEAVQALGDRLIAERLKGAALVVRGRVTEVEKGGEEKQPAQPDWDDPRWAYATMSAQRVMAGNADTGAELAVAFPTSRDRAWAGNPRLRAGQEGIFILRTMSQREGQEKVRRRAFTALDRRDVLDLSERDRVVRLLKEVVL